VHLANRRGVEAEDWAMRHSWKKSRLSLAVLAAGLLGAGGCACTQWPRIDPTGERIFVRPEAAAPRWEDPSAVGPNDPGLAATLSPREAVAPVGSEVVLLAGVVADDGYLRTHQRIEWSLEPSGVGHIVAVGDNGLVDMLRAKANRPRKVDNTFAIGSTSPRYLRLGRGTPTTSDDACVLPGQAWLTLTSPVEGTSHVTAFAPGAKAWDAHTQSATIHWVDAQVCFPPPAINPAGTRHVLTTTVTRHSDQLPCAGWIVRYEIIDGPPAGFAPDGSPSIEVTTDATGQAGAEVFQTEPGPGTNKIGIEVIRPGTLGGSSAKPLAVGRGATLKTWTSPDLAIRVAGPATASIGATLTYAIEVSNPGDLPAEDVRVSDQLPPALSYVESDPPAEQIAGKLQWPMGQLGAGERRTLQLRCRAEQTGSVTNCADATAAGGLQASHCASTTVTSPDVQVQVTGPSQARVGSDVTFQVVVTNRSQVATGKLRLKDELDPGMEHATGVRVIANDVGPLAAGESQAVEVTLRITQAGRLCQRVEVTGDEGIRATTEWCITAVEGAVEQPGPAPRGEASIKIEKMGPETLAVGETAEFHIEVTNMGSRTLTGLTVKDTCDASLEPVEATDGRLTWTIASLAPGEKEEFDVDCRCRSASARACNRVTVTSNEGIREEAEACLEIRGGPPELTMTVRDVPDQVTAGRGVTYRIEVSNEGPTSQTNVVVEATIPSGMVPAPIGISGRTRANIAGQSVRFEPLAELPAGSKVLYYVRVDTQQAGEYTFSARLQSDDLASPIAFEEQTSVRPPDS
jgi:uncharacterized repeat protein (TIGR01451 family)